MPTDRIRKQARVMRRLRLLATLGLLLAPATGCTILSGIGSQLKHQEALDEFMVNYRNEAWAAKAWHCRKQRFCNHKYMSDLEAGFRAGYETVAAGGDGCTPSLCPQSYWGWQYQNAEGQSRMNAWFEGFPLGVQAAEQDGIGHWSQIRSSMAVPPPVVPVAAAMAATAGKDDGPAESGLSDRSEAVPVPLADPQGADDVGLDDAGLDGAGDAPAPTRALAPKEAAKPSGTAKPAPKNVAQPAVPQPAVPQPAVPQPAVPQPKLDPFGFD